MKLVLCGPPHSGKSCLREGLKQALLATRGVPGAPPVPYPYVLTANPDGEGAWYQEAYRTDPERAKRMKAAYKGGFTREFVALVTDAVRACELPLVIVDIGGRTTPENEQISAGATHALILYNDPAALPEWRAFCARAGLRVWAEIRSVRNEPPRDRDDADALWRGTVTELSRGGDNHANPTVRRLAEILAAELRGEAPPPLPVGASEKGGAAARGDLPEAAFQATVERIDLSAPSGVGADLLRVAFGRPTGNDEIARDARERLAAMTAAGELAGGPLLKVDGPMSVPLAMVIVQAVAPLYAVVAMNDPRMHRFVVVASDPARAASHAVGDLLD